jgi:hypothetical protein
MTSQSHNCSSLNFDIYCKLDSFIRHLVDTLVFHGFLISEFLTPKPSYLFYLTHSPPIPLPFPLLTIVQYIVSNLPSCPPNLQYFKLPLQGLLHWIQLLEGFTMRTGFFGD